MAARHNNMPSYRNMAQQVIAARGGISDMAAGINNSGDSVARQISPTQASKRGVKTSK